MGAPQGVALHSASAPPALLGKDRMVDPGERVRWAIETARGVLDGRLDAADAAAALTLQQEQTAALLRRDRDSVTRHENEAVATRLRLLAEQVADADPRATDRDHRLAVAEALGALAAVLR